MADNLVLGRGKLFFAPYPAGQTTGGVRGYFGNTPALTIAQTSTQLDHYSSEAGLKIKDASVVLQTDQTVTFDVDNINDGNLALWFGGNNVDALPSDAPGDLGNIAVIGRQDSVYGALYFEANNPKGQNKNYWWPYVNLRPNGNFALKGDAWQQMSFTAEALKRDASTQRVYVYKKADGSPVVDASPEFTVSSASVAGDFIATTATLTPATPQVHLTPFDVPFTLNGGTGGDELVAYLFVNNGTVVIASMTEAVGHGGTVQMSIPAVGTVHIEAYSNPLATGGTIGVSGSIVAT